MAVERSHVGPSSSFWLSWFDLSTPGYDLSNKKRGVVKEIMFWWTELSCDRRPLEPLEFPIIPVAVHLLVHLIIGFTTLRKHAFSNILKILPPKNENFQIEIFDIFHISAQNIDCGYSLEPPRRGGFNEYPQSMFWAEIRKIIYTPVNPNFTI